MVGVLFGCTGTSWLHRKTLEHFHVKGGLETFVGLSVCCREFVEQQSFDPCPEALLPWLLPQNY